MTKKYVLIILALSLATHFIFFSRPAQIVFDEVHFGKFVSGYFKGEYFFDIHPPLGKLLIAGFAKIFNFKPEYAFANIGESYPNKHYLILRFLPNLAGAFLPLIIFLLALELSLSKIASFGAAVLVSLDNAILAQSRFILTDAFLLIFGFACLLFYFKYRRSQKLRYLALAGILGALAVSVKWTGLTFLALASVIEIIEILKSRNFKKTIHLAAFLAVIPFIIYFSIFWIHFSLLTKSGPGDAFMTPSFQKTLKGSIFQTDNSIRPKNLLQKFTELNIEMYISNKNLSASHPYSSKWYTWPFMIRSIFYWVSGDSKIYFLGNPIIWWGSTVALLVFVLSAAFYRGQIKETPIILFSGYLLNLLPFIGIPRVMFLYHYLSALIFAILIMAYMIDQNRHRARIFAVLIIASAVGFVYFAPFTYGLPLSPQAFQNRLWLNTWR